MDKPVLLLIEDEALLSFALEVELTDEGFEVVLALDGQAGLGALDQDAERFSGLVTDIRLPGPDGWALAKRARELVPTMPVVYMSGDSGLDWATYGVPKSMMLAKPFAVAQLSSVMTQLINDVPA